MYMRFIRPTSLNSIRNIVHVDAEVCEIIGVEVLLFRNPVTLNQSQGHLD